MKLTYASILIFAGACFSILGTSCAPLRKVAAFCRSTSDFHLIGENVFVEEMEDAGFALQIQSVIPQYSDSVQRKLESKFTEPVRVYVCHTTQSFCKHTGSKHPGPRAAVIKTLFISPRLRGSPDWENIVYHELVHLLLWQHLGAYQYQKIPIWFHEGLATMIANGGGSGDVTDSLAISAMISGKHFDPVASESFLHSRSFERNDISIWTHYRQAMLFVTFMRDKDSQAFRTFVRELLSGRLFRKAVQDTYHETVADLWRDFLADPVDAQRRGAIRDPHQE